MRIRRVVSGLLLAAACVLLGDAAAFAVGPPSPPSGLAADPGETSVSLTWVNGDAEGDQWEYRLDGGEPVGFTTASPTATAYVVEGLTAATSYVVDLREVDPLLGPSDWSSVAFTTDSPPPPPADPPPSSEVTLSEYDRALVTAGFGFLLLLNGAHVVGSWGRG